MTPTLIQIGVFVVALVLLATGMPIAFALGSTAHVLCFLNGWNALNFLPETVFAER